MFLLFYGYRLTLLNISRFLHNCRFINNKLQLRDKQSILPGSSSFYLLFLGMFAEIRLVFLSIFYDRVKAFVYDVSKSLNINYSN